MKKKAIAALLLLITASMLSLIAPALALDDDEFSGYKADSLTIKVGYFGGPYYNKAVFTVDQLSNMDLVNADYTFIDNMPSVVIDHVKGVKLADIVSAAGIDLGSVQTFYFWTCDKQSSYYTSFSKTALIDTPRFCYYSLPDNFDSDTGKGNEYATQDGVHVDSVIALADDWNRCIAGAGFGSDYLNLNTNTRFRLIFGQTNSYERTASRSAKWIHEIVVELGGAPTIKLDASVLEGEVGSVLRTVPSVTADSAVKNNEAVQWSSSDDSIASVDKDGNITVHTKGTAVITATFGGVSASVTVNGTDKKSDSSGTALIGNGTGEGGSTDGNAPTSSGSSAESGSDNTAGAVTFSPEPTSSAKKKVDVSKATEIQPAQVQTAQTASGPNQGGVQNWRVYEMSDTATALPIVEEKNPLLGFTGIAAICFFLAGVLVYTALFYRNIRGKRHVFKHKPK
jgi:hypothetical protein